MYFNMSFKVRDNTVEEFAVSAYPEQDEEIRSFIRLFEQLENVENERQQEFHRWDVSFDQTQRFFVFDRESKCLFMVNQQPDRQIFIHGLENIRRYLEDWLIYPLPNVTEEQKEFCRENVRQMHEEYDALEEQNLA